MDTYYDENLIDNEGLQENSLQNPAGKLKEEKNKARGIAGGMQKLGANMYQTGKKRETEGKKGGAFLTQSGRMMNRGGKVADAVGKEKGALGTATKILGKGSKFASGQMLAWAWGITFSVYGSIFGLLYLNIHAFGRLVMPSMVCPFGEEWTGGMLKKAGTGGKLMNYGLKWGEGMLLVFLDIIFLIAVLGIMMLINFMINNIFAPISPEDMWNIPMV